MKIATWNVNGIRARLEQVIAFVERERPDVLCLQEIKASPQQISGVMFLLPDHWSYWHGAGGYSGVSIHLAKAAFAERPQFVHPPFDHENRVVEAHAGDTVLASVYVPNGGKDYAAKLRFLEALAEHVAALHAAGKRVVLCGDLNVAREEIDVHPTQRRATAIGQRPDERALFARLFEAGLVDVTRVLHPANDRFFTWWPMWKPARERNFGWRIDYVLASEALAGSATRCVVLRGEGTSDHAPLLAEIG